MHPTRSLFLLGIPFWSLGFALSLPERIGHNVLLGRDNVPRSVPDDSLKSALEGHLAPKYRDGVFESGHDAIDNIRKDDPELAARLVDLARQDAAVRDYVRKRQNGNSTTSSSLTSSDDPSPSTSGTSSSSPSSSPPTTTSIESTITTTSSSSGQSSSSISQTSPSSTSFSSSASNTFPSPTLSSSFSTPVTTPTTVVETSSTVAITTTTPDSVDTSSVSSPTSSTSSSEGQSSAGTTVVTSAGSDQATESSTTGVSTASSSTEVLTTPTTTAPVVPATTSTDPAPNTSGTQTGVLVPVTISSTLPGGSVVGQTTNAFVSSAPTSVVIPITTSDGQGNPLTISTTAPAIVLTSTDSNGSPVITTSPLASVQVANGGSVVTSAPAFGASTENLVSTDPQGQVVTRTVVPGGGTVSELHLETTTLSNGQVQTVTSLDIVGPSQATVDAAGASPSATKNPTLASDATVESHFFAAVMAVLFGGTIGLAVTL